MAAVLSLAACAGDDSPGAPALGGQGGGGGNGGNGGNGGDDSSTAGAAERGGGGSGGEGGTMCVDECPASNGGIQIGCKKRFMYGVNYAWHHFGGDFGGIAKWGKSGVAGEQTAHAEKLADMRAHGASVVRWWMLPELRGESVALDAEDNPTGLGRTTVKDVEKALELAEQADVYLMFCLFSFDGFRPTRTDSDLRIPSLRPMVTDVAKRTRLMNHVVQPLARAVEQSPYRHRMIAWDVINEPERAISGKNPYGDPAYDTDPELEAVTHEQMETFISHTIRALRAESHALVTIGGAAMKWSRAWKSMDIDFYTFHIYDWVNQYWPFNQSPSHYGVDDKPVVMGEFPIAGLLTATVPVLLESWYKQGYAGALSWSYSDATAAELDVLKQFADERPCETRY